MFSGDIDVFRNSDAVFWVTFCCIMVIVPLFFVRWPREVTDLTLLTTRRSVCV